MSGRKDNSGGGGGSSGPQLRRRKKSMAELVNEQMTSEMAGGSARSARRTGKGAAAGGGAAYDPFLEEDEDGMGVAEDLQWDEAGSLDGDAPSSHTPKPNEQGTSAAAASSSLAKGKKRSRSEGAIAGGADAGGLQPPEQRLRRRGPLDAGLSQGKYAAQPVANVEALMDDLFGDLDMGDMDAEGEEDAFGDAGDADTAEGEAGDGYDDDDDDDDDDGVGRKKKAKRSKKAKDLTEEEYTAFLAAKRKRRRAALTGSGLSVGAVDGEEGGILEQLESLRQAQLSLVKGPGSASSEKGEKAEAAARAGTQEAVKHYIMLYAQLLRIRVKLQPAVTRAISMPQYYAKGLFTEPLVDEQVGDEDAAGESEATSDAYNEVVTELLDLLATLYSFTSPASSANAAAASSSSASRQRLRAPSFAEIHKYHTHHVKKNADACLAYWGSKLVQTNSAKLKTISQPLPHQIEAILANMPRLRRKVQKNRAHLPILAHPDHERAAAAAAAKNGHVASGSGSGVAGPAEESATARNAEAAVKRAMAMADGDVDEEIYDDSDFLRELVRRGGAVAHRLEQQLAEINRATLPAKEASRKGFHRITKGKEVNYEPRPKLVGFLMSEALENTGRNEVVLKSLFQ